MGLCSAETQHVHTGVQYLNILKYDGLTLTNGTLAAVSSVMSTGCVAWIIYIAEY